VPWKLFIAASNGLKAASEVGIEFAHFFRLHDERFIYEGRTGGLFTPGEQFA
jgi:hypothetical protein